MALRPATAAGFALLLGCITCVAAASSVDAADLYGPALTGIAQDGGSASASTYSKVGKASWYGGWHIGRRTASGERFDGRKMTAAHPTLPLDTRVRVINLRTGRTIEVLVNDRSSRRTGRVIDLSARAAAVLGIKRQGIAQVRIERIDS
jgi:rare lipoprotein A